MKKILFLFFVFVPLLYSQESIDKLLYLTSNRASIAVNYQTLKIGDETLSQLSFPVQLTIPLSNRITFSVANNSAMSKYEDSELNGIGETRLGVRYILPGERIMLRGLVGLPTGKTKLNNEQFFISQLISLNPFDYPVSYYGQGVNANISAAFAYPIARYLVVGLGAAYSYRGAFYPRESETGGKFDPGDEIIADMGFDLKLGSSASFNFDFAYTLYSRDKYDDVEIFELGDKISLYGNFAFQTSKIKHNIFVIHRIKSNNTSLSDISEEDLQTGAQIDAGYRGNIPLSHRLSIFLKLDAKIYKDSEHFSAGELFKTGESSVFGLGAGLNINASDFVLFEIFGGYKTGTIKLPDSELESDISGLNVNLNSIIKF